MKIILFHGVRVSIPNWKPSPNRVSTGFSQIASPTTVLPKDDHTMIYAIHVLVDVSKCLDIPILEFSIIWMHPPCLPGYKQILRLLLVLRNPALWR